MFISEKFFNLINCYQDNDLNLYKNKNIEDGWNAKAQSINKIIQLDNNLGFEIYNTLTTKNYEYVVGFSNKTIDELKTYSYLDYSIYIKTGSFGRIRLFKNEYPLLTISNLYKNLSIISGFINDTWNFYADNKLLYTFAYKPKLPLYLYVFMFNNKDYPIKIKFNYDNKQYFEPKDIQPEQNNKINIFQIFTITFDKQLQPSTVNNNTVKLKNITTNQEEEITINHTIKTDENKNKYSEIKITNKNKLDYNSTYEILLNDIYNIDNILIYPQKFTYTTITQDETSIISDKLYPSSDINDVYYKSKILYDILDIDKIVQDGEKYNFSYYPTKYNPISNEYEVDTTTLIKHDNKSMFIDLYQHELLYEFKEFFERVKQNDKIDTYLLNKIKSLLFKNAININYFKGSREQIAFIHKIFAELTNRHMAWADPDPFFTYKYRVSSDLEFLDNIKYTKIMTHPSGWVNKFIHIDKQISKYLDNIEKEWRKEIKYDTTNVNITYLDVNYYVTKINSYYSYIDFYIKFIANAKWQDLQRPQKFTFNPNKYNSPTKYQVENLYKEIKYPTHLSIKQTKLYQDDNAKFEINYLKTGMSIDYIHNFEFRGVNQFNKKNPHYKTIVNLGKNYNYRVWYNFYFKDFHYKINYYLIPFIHQRFRLDNLPYAQNTFGIENTIDTLKNDNQIKNFKTNFKSKKTYLINKYILNYTNIDNNDIIINKIDNDENELIEINNKGLFLEFKYIIDDIIVNSNLNRLKINKNIADNLKIIGVRKNYSFQII